MDIDGSASPLRGRDIVCFASQSWGSHWCTPQQICARLSAYGRVLYVEPLRSPLWRVRRSATQSSRPGGRAVPILPNVWLLTLPAIFVPMALYRRWSWLRRWNNWLMSAFVAREAKRLGFGRSVAWVYQITAAGAPLFRQMDAMVYDCIDEWAGGTEVAAEKRFFAQLDHQLCRSADVLFVGSRGLQTPRRDLNPRVALVPQGVDLEHFLPTPDFVPPPDLAALPHPVVGLVGVLNKERLDIELLCHLARERPHWSLVLVGPVWKGLDTGRLQAHSNIHLLGNKPREQLGRYIQGFDVCMLPYLINEFTRNIFPLKLFEYLASGKPFVATPVPACAEFPALIRTADGPAAFLQAVDAALAENDPALRKARIDLARQNDWNRRTADKVSFLGQFLATRVAPRPVA